jgi:hypothetical protein
MKNIWVRRLLWGTLGAAGAMIGLVRTIGSKRA